MEEKTSRKYIPPHRRGPTTLFTSHAQERKDQRDLSDKNIETAIQRGQSQKNQSSSVYRNRDTHVVVAKNKKVITVVDNKRNTRFDIMRKTSERYEILLTQANQGNDAAMCELAELYLEGQVGPKDPQQAHDWLLKAAEKENSHAMCLLYDIFRKGSLGKKDPDAAQLWLKKAAKRNNVYALAVLAQTLLAEYLKNSRNNPLNPLQENLQNEIEVLLRRAMARGNTRAMWQWAQILEHGWFGEKNLDEAIRIYTEAALSGSPASLHSLYGFVQEQKFDSQKFEHILKKACSIIEETSSNLAIEIGLALIQGELGTHPVEGLALLESAAHKRNLEAVKVLVKCYGKGIGFCKADPEKAQKWFLQLQALLNTSAESGNIQAMTELGVLLLKDKNVVQNDNLNKAQAWLLQAIDLGDVRAMYYLSGFYLEKNFPFNKVNRLFVFNLLKNIIESAEADRELKIRSLTLIKKHYLSEENSAEGKTASFWYHQNTEDENKETKEAAEGLQKLELNI